MKSGTIILMALITLCDGQELQSLVDLCANPPQTPPKTLSDKIGLPSIYKVSGSVTDFMKASTSLLTETATNEYRVLERRSRDQVPERWINELTGAKQNFFVNLTSSECVGDAPKPLLFNITRFESIIGNDTSSLYSIINGLLQFDKSATGFLVETETEVVGGVSTVKWISCVNGTNANDTKVLVEVRYAGEDSIRPAQSEFSNPLVLSVRLVEIPSFNSTTALSHVAVELDRYETPQNNEANIEHGVFCNNRNGTKLPIKPIDEFAAVLNYFDYSTNKSEVVEVLYSTARQLLIVSGDSFESGNQFLKIPAQKFRNGTDYIIHDFKYGYEFTLNKDACNSFDRLGEATNDVLVDVNKTYHMKPLDMVLVDQTLRFDQYQNEQDLLGISRKTYRAFDVRDETVVEAHLTDDGQLISLSTYRSVSRHLSWTLKITPIPLTTSKLQLKLAQLSDCYDDGQYSNNTWFVNVKNKNVTDVKRVGLNALNVAVSEAVSKNVYPIIPYRLLVFWVEGADGGLTMILRMSEKTEVQPAPVDGYNYTAEISTLEMFRMMNESVQLEKMPIELQKAEGVKEEWLLDGKTMTLYPGEANNGFLGYTGGAMFVLAIFCLLIGVSIGAVGVFVATRRQRISTLAYQVFE